MKRKIKKLLAKGFHKVAHWTDLYFGKVECWWQDERLMVGFRCSTCGKIEGIHECRRLKEASKLVKEGRSIHTGTERFIQVDEREKDNEERI